MQVGAYPLQSKLSEPMTKLSNLEEMSGLRVEAKKQRDEVARLEAESKKRLSVC